MGGQGRYSVSADENKKNLINIIQAAKHINSLINVLWPELCLLKFYFHQH